MPANLDPITIVSSLLPDVLGRNRQRNRDDLAQLLLPVLRSHGGAWVGSLGRADEESVREPLAHYGHRNGFDMHPVALDDADLEGGHDGFAHSVIWPLFHGMDEHCDLQPGFWKAYLELNRKFALHIARAPRISRRIWVHDCGLIHTGSMLRAAMPEVEQLGMFVHLPFPPLDTLRRLASASQIVNALLDYDLVGFQTPRDLQNFGHAVRFFAPRANLTTTDTHASISVGRRTLHATVLPVGADFEELSARASERSVLERMRTLQEDIGPYTTLLGVDRLDYTSGLLQRLDAFEMTLERYPRLRERVVLYQQVVPGRQDTGALAGLKQRVEEAVGRICGRFSTRSWSPVRYRYGTVGAVELSAMYRLAAAALVTPLRDGMNLTAKDFVASRIDHGGALILSEFAGAADQLSEGALLVNPYDTERTARSIVEALNLNSADKARRMRAMRASTRETHASWWARQFIDSMDHRRERTVETAAAPSPHTESIELG